MKQGTLQRFSQPLLDFLFPPLCLSCGDRLGSEDRFLCAHCAHSLTRVCETDPTMCVLNERFARTQSISAFAPLYYFEEHGVLQDVVHALKYGGMTSVGECFGRQLGAHLQTQSAYADIHFIVPIPLHVQKERERGYNQSDWICRGIARVLQVPVERRILRREKNTRTQTKLTAAERIENVSGAFTVEPSALSSLRRKHVLLVDDVVTTGATLQACAATLIRAGAQRVVCASIGAAKLERAESDPLLLSDPPKCDPPLRSPA